MLEKPAIEDQKIIACLYEEYGLRIATLDFLPLGGNLCTAVYRAVAEDGTSYFCKLRCSEFTEISVEVPKYLGDQGIAPTIPPLATQTGRLWTTLDSFYVILFPFVEGKSGFDVELTEQHWQSFGKALKKIHTTSLPPALRQKIPHESYSTESRDICTEILHRLENETFTDPISAGLADFLLPRRSILLDLMGRAERLELALKKRSPEFVLCHADIHPGNLFLDTQGALYIIDWDSLILAPKERDLIFIGGGQGYVARTAQEEEVFFYKSYGPSTVDLVAMAYYRCERNLYDLSVECPRILSTTLGDRDRAQSLEIVGWLFLPDASIDQAYRAVSHLAGQGGS